MADDYLWWCDGVIYQIYPRSFADSSGSGIGDLNGITEKLDYLADLGVDAVWLSPINPSPDVDFGYDVSDYLDVDPKFGGMADFDRLVKEAQKRGIRIVMDLVLNHTSDQHEWFRQSRSARDNAYRDWYIWHDPDEHGSRPITGSLFSAAAAGNGTRKQNSITTTCSTSSSGSELAKSKSARGHAGCLPFLGRPGS